MELYNSPSYMGEYIDETTETFGTITEENFQEWNKYMTRIFKTAIPRCRSEARQLQEIPIIVKLILRDKRYPDTIWFVNENLSSEPKDKLSILGGHVEDDDCPEILSFSQMKDFREILQIALFREIVEELSNDCSGLYKAYIEKLYNETKSFSETLPYALKDFGIYCEPEDAESDVLYYHFMSDLSLAFYFIADVEIDPNDIYKHYVPYRRDDYNFGKHVLETASRQRREDLAKSHFETIYKDDIRILGRHPRFDRILDMMVNTPNVWPEPVSQSKK